MGGRRAHRLVAAVAVVAVAVVAALVVGAGRATACSCERPSAPEEAMAAADMVFVGTVVDVGEVVHGDPALGPSLRRIRLEVSEVFKGPVPAQVDVHTPDGGEAACGYDFEVGRAELVYASRWDGPMTASFCSRTAPVQHAAADLEALGNSMPPGPLAARDAPVTGTGWVFPLAAVALLVMPLVTWGAMRLGERDRPPG